MKTKCLWLILPLLIALLACEKKNADCPSINFTNVTIVDDSEIIIRDENKEDLLLIINSKEDFDKNITIKKQDKWGLGDINFDKNTLIIGKKRVNAVQGKFISSEIVNNCEKGSLTYQVKFDNGGYQAIGLVFYGAIIPKYEQTITSEISIN